MLMPSSIQKDEKCLPAVEACRFKDMGSLLDWDSHILHADGLLREVLILATSPVQTTATSGT